MKKALKIEYNFYEIKKSWFMLVNKFSIKSWQFACKFVYDDNRLILP